MSVAGPAGVISTPGPPFKPSVCARGLGRDKYIHPPQIGQPARKLTISAPRDPGEERYVPGKRRIIVFPGRFPQPFVAGSRGARNKTGVTTEMPKPASRSYGRIEGLSGLHYGVDDARTLHHTGPFTVRGASLAVVV